MLSLSGQLGWDQECHAPKLLEIVLVRVGPVVSSRSLFFRKSYPKTAEISQAVPFQMWQGLVFLIQNTKTRWATGHKVENRVNERNAKYTD